MGQAIRIIGIDPGLRRTGWGVIERDGTRLSHIADGLVCSDEHRSLAERLVMLMEGLEAVLAQYTPHEAAVEETFVNKDARATLKLGHARAVALMVPARLGLPVAEYAPNQIKKAVVGAGHAEKEQVQKMIRLLLPKSRPESADAADALAVAICHAHHSARRVMLVAVAR